MGAVCQQCYDQEVEQEGAVRERTEKIRLGVEMNEVIFTLSTCSVHKFSSQCLVIYADHCSELSVSPVINKLHPKIRRKLFEYLTLAEEETQKKHQLHSLARTIIPHMKHNNLLFVKLPPWNGKSQYKIEQKIYNLTKSFLQVFSLRKITSLTIIEPDTCLGVHYSMFYNGLMRGLKQYCKSIKRVTIIFNKQESMEYFVQKIKQTFRLEDNLQATKYVQQKRDVIKSTKVDKQERKKVKG